MALPRFIVLRSPINAKYLIHLRDDQDYLQFSGTDFTSLHVKYEVVQSSTGDGLVHLKCCYNNKYWVCRQNEYWITAEAPEMEEDKSKWSCTLFKPVFFTSNRIGFCHVHINKNVSFQQTSTHYLYVGATFPTGHDYLDFFNWESLPILPRYIALKGSNGNYLSAYTRPKISESYSNPFTDALKGVSKVFRAVDAIAKSTEDYNVHLSFNCTDKGDQTVGNEVFTTPDHKIRLKSNHIGKFWRLSPTWIWPDSEDDTNNNPATLFELSHADGGKIALKNMGNGMFCMSLTLDGKNDCLNAHSTTICEPAKFEVVELVVKRKISGVSFHEKAARIYEKQISHEVKSTDLNHTKVDQQATMEFEYTEEESRTWTTSNSLTNTVETEISAGPPDVVQGKLKLSKVETKTLEKGKTLATKRVRKYTKTVNVPPMSKVVANFRVTQALCDVPYSYIQTETLHNGTIVTNEKDDGLYTCVHTDVHFEVKQEGI